MIDPALARRIRVVGLDVDGVLTDGGIYLGDAGGAPLELKRYDIQDGLGIHFLRQAGLRVVIITGRVSQSVALRAAELQIEDVAQDAEARKLPALRRLLLSGTQPSPNRRAAQPHRLARRSAPRAPCRSCSIRRHE